MEIKQPGVLASVILSFVLATTTLTLARVASAQEGLAGLWLIEMDVDPVTVGLMDLEETADGWVAHVEGGPVGLEVDGNKIEVVVDSRDIAGFVFERKLSGELDGDEITGTVTMVNKPDSDQNGRSWKAVRFDPDAAPEGEPRPDDILGTWVAVQGLDFRKYKMDLTPEAQEWHDGYLLHLDQPNVRCVSIGITQLLTWSYPFEIMQNGDRMTILYEVDSEVRRIYLNDHEPSEYFPNAPMGFSRGHWEGSTFVVETDRVSQNVRDFRGEPISENARLEERYTLNEDGTELSAVIMVIDPDNYIKNPIRRRRWQKNNDMEIFPYECDPMGFFRQLHEDEESALYFGRAYRAF